MAVHERQGRLEELLTAIATVDRVLAALRDYTERDYAIEMLEDDVAIQHRQLLGRLRAVLTPHTRAAFAARRNVTA